MRKAFAFIASLSLAASSFSGSRDFDGTTQYLENAASVISTYPHTMFCWGQSDSDTLQQSVLNTGDTAGTADNFEIAFDGSAVGDPVFVNARRSSSNIANTTTGYTTGVWTNVTGVQTSATSRAAFINGGSKGTNSTSAVPTSLDTTRIGARARSAPVQFFDGRIAQCAVWNVALTDAEVNEISRGLAPIFIETGALLNYWPVWGAVSPEPDMRGSAAMTLVNAPANADGPPIFFPAGPI